MTFTPRNHQIKLDADSDESVADMPPLSKRCYKCGVFRSIVNFHADGRMPHCKKCWNEKSKQTRLRMFDCYNQYHSARRSVFRKATPAWLTKEQQDEINDCCWRARDCSLVTGEPYEVDHVIPIKGRGVCGLHVPWNLQLLPMTVNRVKSNKVL